MNYKVLKDVVNTKVDKVNGKQLSTEDYNNTREAETGWT